MPDPEDPPINPPEETLLDQSVEFDFDQLIEIGHGLDGSEFGVWRPPYEPAVDVEPEPPKENERVFLLKAHELIGALRSVGATLGKVGDTGDVSVSLTGETGEVGTAGFETSSVWGTCAVTLSTTSYGIRPGIKGPAVTFRVSHKRLRELSALAEGEVIEFRLRLDRMRLTIVVDERHVPVPIWPPYPTIEQAIPDSRYQEISGGFLTAVASYLALFAQRDDVESQFSVVNVSENAATCGSRGAIGRVHWSGTAMPTLSVDPDSLAAVVALSGDLSISMVKVAKTERSYFLATDRVRLTLPRSSKAFPISADSLLKKRVGETFVSRDSLLSALRGLRLASSGGLRIRLPAALDEDKSLRLSVVTSDGDEWTNAIAAADRARSPEPSRGWEGVVPFAMVLALVEHFESANVEFSYCGSIIIISDESPDGAFATDSVFGRFKVPAGEKETVDI